VPLPAAPLLLALLVGPIPHLSWTPGEPQVQTGFLIERAEQATCAFSQVGTATGPAFDDLGATLNVPVCYQVKSYNADGVSPRSNTACATPTATGGGFPDLSQPFTFTGVSALFRIDLGGFQCVRTVGGSAKVYIRQAGVNLVAPKALQNPPKDTTFTMRCRQLSPTSVELSIDGVVKLTAP
jgi:hypothetical protein